MEEKQFKIYGLALKDFPENIRYIGYTKQLLNRRLSSHRRPWKTDISYRANWARKYNKNIIIIELDSFHTKEEALQAEINYIKLFKSLGAKLINGTTGGEGGWGIVYTEERRRKISEAVKGEKNGMFGKTISIEGKKKISETHKGRKKSEAELEKRRVLGKKQFLNKPEWFKNEFQEKAWEACRKPILQYTLDGIFIQEFASVKLAAKHVKRDTSSVTDATRRINGTCAGFKWVYKIKNNDDK